MSSKLFFATILSFFLGYSCATLTSSAINPVKSALSPPSNQVGTFERKLSSQVSNPMKSKKFKNIYKIRIKFNNKE